MNDETWRRDEVESPCIRVCVVHPAERLCTGCLRSLDEIAAWSGMTPEERRAILDDLPARRGRLQRRRGGRRGRLAQASEDKGDKGGEV
ncbi:MAG: DUF1289 domain-containing protein [Tranquillimonas sp.]|jgi:predicted Fe-S protein YdhL (DUF1289 family)